MRIFFIALLFTVTSLYGQTFYSTQNKVTLIELYTSQGCSSCPVADEWLGELKKREGLFSTFIPIAFHITYWDFIGWKDIFANKMNDNRQRYYANNVWKNKAVYTPQFVVDSYEYKAWFNRLAFPKLQKEYAGELILKINNDSFDINFSSKKKMTQQVYVNIAILGFDYEVDVKRGENSNRRLHHDFVVLKHHQYFASLNKGELTFNGNVPKVIEDGHQKAVVVWLSSGQKEIIQAVGGYIKD